MDLSHLFRRRSLTFEGGVKLPDMKQASADFPIADFMEPQREMVFPMLQHQGEECEVLVREGERVLRDQLIGRPAGLGANIYSSVSGTVTHVEPRLHPSGQMVMSVVVENDHRYETMPAAFPPASFKELTKVEILDRIRYAGIVGMGMDGYPTSEKLSQAIDGTIEYVLLNGCESEPYLTSDYRVMLEDSWRVINGLRIVLSLFPEAQGRICIEDNKPKALEALKEHIEDDSRISLCSLKSKYPQGDENMLVETVTGRQVPFGKLPKDAGCIVLNIDTSVAISRAVTQARPLQRRIVTVAGDCVRTPKNYRVRIGTSMEELIEQVGPLAKRPRRVIYGGPMMGHTVQSLDFPVVKTSSCILLLSSKAALHSEESACIHCGACQAVCPYHLQPNLLYEAVLKKDHARFEKLHGNACSLCGSCSYVCPAKRELVQKIGEEMRSGSEVES